MDDMKERTSKNFDFRFLRARLPIGVRNYIKLHFEYEVWEHDRVSFYHREKEAVSLSAKKHLKANLELPSVWEKIYYNPVLRLIFYEEESIPLIDIFFERGRFNREIQDLKREHSAENL